MRLSPLIVLLFATALFAQEKVETKSGAIYRGAVTKNTEDTVVLVTKDSVIIFLPKAAIHSLYYDVRDEDAGDFWSLGAAFGMPALVQLVTSYEWDQFGVRVSAGYIGERAGLQLNAFRKFMRKEHFSHELSLITGYVDHGRDYVYIGPSYGVHFYGAFGEAGFALAGDDFSDLLFIFQLGYLFEFR